MNENILISNKYTAVLSILILSLFIQFRFEVANFILRPFDVLTVLFFIYTYATKNNKQDQKLSVGFFYLIPFFFIHFTSALTISGQNFFKEFFQIILLTLFAFVLSHSVNKINYKKQIIYLLQGSLCIMTFVIFWHLYNGYIVAWKQLPDSRIIFTIISILIFASLNLYEKKVKNLTILLFIFLLLVLSSGERKALGIFLFLLSMHYSNGKILKIIFTSFAGIFFVAILVYFSKNSYLQTQFSSLLNLFDSSNIDYALSTGMLSEKDTFSGLQRAFVFNISKIYFLENPIFGIGTNNFVNLLLDDYYNYPKIFKAGIHNEFQRVLVENGLLGLFFYLLIWFKSWIRTKNITNIALENGLMNKLQYTLCTYSIYLTLLIYVGTEASSLRSFVILIIISLLPDYLKYHFSINPKNIKLN